MKNKVKLLTSLFIIIQLIACIKSIAIEPNTGESYEEVMKAIQEVAYAYYRRGPNIQYNSMKGNPSWYAPEEATSKNINYIVCSAFVKNVYYDLLGVKIPPYTDSLLKYTKKYIGNSEVIAYGYKDGEELVMQLYDETAENNLITIRNPSIEDIIPYLHVRRCAYIYWSYSYGI